MIAIRNINTFQTDNIDIDDYWNFGLETEAKMHRIHAYPAKFPAFITTKAIEYAKREGIKIDTMADIFCGCGTTAFEARQNNIDFWGCDINPVATLIAQVKSRKYEADKLQKYYKQIENFYSFENINTEQMKNINERIFYWYDKEKTEALLKLKEAIKVSVPAKSVYRNLILCAFSNILKSTSKWLTKSIKPQLDPDKVSVDVFKVFQEQIRFMQKAINECSFNGKSKVEIETTNYLEKTFPNPFVDLIITSPPYVTSYEYADLHQLSSLWLDFTDDYKKLRKGSIGSLFHDDAFRDNIKKLNVTGEDIVWQLYDRDKRKAKSAAKYFVDMQDVSEKCFSMLNHKGMALFVIGNTEYKGIRIDNAKHLTESLLKSGFRNVKVTRRKISKKILTPYRDRRGKFTTDANSRKVYAEEFIVVGRKLWKKN